MYLSAWQVWRTDTKRSIREARSVRRLETPQNEAIRRKLQFPICQVDDVSMHQHHNKQKVSQMSIVRNLQNQIIKSVIVGQKVRAFFFVAS